MVMYFGGVRGVVREDRATRIIFREMGWGGTRWVVSLLCASVYVRERSCVSVCVRGVCFV